MWYRRNSFFGQLADSGYTLRRIVDKDGNYTSAFPDMPSKLDQNKGIQAPSLVAGFCLFVLQF
ncbi:hypothetical protein QUB56_14700 [Microcoleus sp. AR_TQ3_B6]|uniref:hypothetical protein n=1 Tax=Microcoleus sp. AR_TQ3_B6 TaxID=3055284 RepID=UPI002FCEB13F